MKNQTDFKESGLPGESSLDCRRAGGLLSRNSCAGICGREESARLGAGRHAHSRQRKYPVGMRVWSKTEEKRLFP